jgi:phage tail-like protein
VVGPIDGGIDGLAWHQVVVDAVLPPGTRIEVQTWAADAIPLPPPMSSAVPSLPLVPPWAPEEPVTMPAAGEPARGEIARPVMSDAAEWERWRRSPYARGATFQLTGNGPNVSSTMTAAPDLARRLRVGDNLMLRAGALSAGRDIATISARTVSVIASGARVLYGAGSELWLLERDGRALDAVAITTVPAAQSIDLSSILVDDGGADISWPHHCAALLRRGDRVELRSGADRAIVDIEAIDASAATITLNAAVAGDFRFASMELVEPEGRMVCARSDGWGQGFRPGSTIEVTHLVGTTATTTALTVVWSDPEVATVWTTLPAPATWISLGIADEPRGTDRGRYLWVKLRLRGARRHPADDHAFATPLVRSLRVVGPRLSYLSYLPALFGRRDADTPTGAVFLERFLAIFEGRLTQIEARYELVARMLNPFAADDDWLAFVASWFDLVLDPTWPRARRARLLAQIFQLYKLRGTREGILRMVEAYTGHRPELIEGFQIRPRAGMVLGCAGVLGCAPLGGLDVDAAAAEELLAMYAHRFVVVGYVDDDCDLDVATLALRALIDAVKPAHTDVDLRVAVPHGRIGLESTIGLDFILGEDRRHDAPLGTLGSHRNPAPILGVDATLLSTFSSGATPMLDEHGSPPVGDFTIR